MSVTYYQNPDGSLAFFSVSEDIGAEITGGEIQEGAAELTQEEYEAALAALVAAVEAARLQLIADAEAEQAAHDAQRTSVLDALATASGLTVEEIEEALA